MTPAIIKSEFVWMRPLTCDDASEEYVGWLNDPQVNRYLETRHTEQSVDSCRKFILNCNKSSTEHLFGIFCSATNKHIGNAKLGFVDHRYSSGQISLFIGDQGYLRKGIGTAVIKLLTTFGFEKLGLERIEAGCYDANLASLRSFLNVGFSVEGYKRNAVFADDRRMGVFILGKVKQQQ